MEDNSSYAGGWRVLPGFWSIKPKRRQGRQLFWWFVWSLKLETRPAGPLKALWDVALSWFVHSLMRFCCGLFINFFAGRDQFDSKFGWVPIHICEHEDILLRTFASSLFWGGNHGVYQSGGTFIWMGSLYDGSSFTGNSGQNGSQQCLPTAKPLWMEICFSLLSEMLD